MFGTVDKKILIIDDDVNMLDILKVAFTKAGMQPLTTTSGQEGLQLFYSFRPDLVILDIMMPRLSGYQICEQIVSMSNTPIILLTALSASDQIVQGLDCGAIDYVTKPFSVKVLLARAQAILRHVEKSANAENLTTYADDYLTVDLERRRVMVSDNPVKLSVTEYNLLAYMLSHTDQVLTFDQILENVWGRQYQGSVEYVHVYMSNLRKKLETDPKQPRYILTEYGIGYRFKKQKQACFQFLTA